MKFNKLYIYFLKLKIAVFLDANKDGGGGYYQSLAVSNSLNKLQNENFSLYLLY